MAPYGPSKMFRVLVLSLPLFLITLSVSAASSSFGGESKVSSRASPSSQCRCFPGDDCWPSIEQWDKFNSSVDGRLIATVPLASPCHNDPFEPYSRSKCEKLQDGWLDPVTHYPDSASVMAPFFANRSCDPFLPRSAQCVVGAYVAYAVNVTKPMHIVKSLNFVKKHNIRLVIRNTGHDYNGKSTGAGALGVWTHHLKDLEIKDYKSKHYTGKAMKMGAGVQGFEAYAAAHQHGMQVVGGECPTVGLAGGYTQGGGHSALASKYGLAADQALEWEVIDGSGNHLKATRHENTDLFWALSGGGGGTYGVVLSLTSKLHKDIPVSGANLTFTSKGVTKDAYYDAISTFHASLPRIVDAGAMSVSFFTNESFALSPLTGPGVPAKKLRELMEPLTDKLQALGIKYEQTVLQFPGYLEEFTAMQFAVEVGTAQYGGRLIPRSVVEKKNAELTDAHRYIAEHGGMVIAVGLNVSKKVAGDVHNAVNPPWREALIHNVITTPWNFTAPLKEMVANQKKMTDDFLPRLEALTPDGGCYLNEGDFRQPNFQQVFYGDNYNRLLGIKDKYDPHHLFYATTAVGSEYWVPQPDGRLCRNATFDE